MRVFTIETLVVILLAYVTCSCSSHKAALEPVVPEPVIPDFSLRVLTETYVDGGTASNVAYTVVPTETGHTVEVTVEGALNLKALFFEMDYDPTLYRPVDCTATSLLDPLATPIEISYLDVPGTIGHGQVVQKYSQHSGFTGDGVLAILELATGPAPAQSVHPGLGQPLSPTPVVFADYYNKFIRVYYNIRGDYNQDGEVNLQDILPLSLYFGNRPSDNRTYGIVPGGPIYDTMHTEPSFYVDGNSDGAIDLSDLDTIGLNFGNSVPGFNICASPDYARDYPFDGSVARSTMLGMFTLPITTGNESGDRAYWEIHLPQMDYANHYWVHPRSGDEVERASIVALDIGDYPPSTDKEFGLAYDAGLGILSWNTNLRGDLDMNNEVNFGDITAVGINTGKQGPFQIDSDQWPIDPSRDGLVDMGDLAMLDYLFANEGNYRVFATTDPLQVPQDATDPQSIQPHSQHGHLELTWECLGSGDRARAVLETTFDPGTYVWIRMFSDGGSESPRSEVIQIP